MLNNKKMNEYSYGIAPVYKIDNVPAYKAGEWPGIKSNKFENIFHIIYFIYNLII